MYVARVEDKWPNSGDRLRLWPLDYPDDKQNCIHGTSCQCSDRIQFVIECMSGALFTDLYLHVHLSVDVTS